MNIFIKKIRCFVDGCSYLFYNSFVNRIPCWHLRKAMYMLGGMKIKKGSMILRNVIVNSPKGISIGERTYINEYCFLDGRGKIEIGNDVTIAIYSKLISAGHVIDDENFKYVKESIYIGNNVAIFTNCVVLAGAYIHDGCVICALSSVNRGEYKKLGIYGGNPAHYIRQRKCSLSYKQEKWKPILR